MVALTQGDAPRRNDYDGRGNLSNEGLLKFCDFFLDVCLDEIDFMNGLLKLDVLLDRYADMSICGEQRLLSFGGGHYCCSIILLKQ